MTPELAAATTTDYACSVSHSPISHRVFAGDIFASIAQRRNIGAMRLTVFARVDTNVGTVKRPSKGLTRCVPLVVKVSAKAVSAGSNWCWE